MNIYHRVGLGDIENTELQLLQQRHCDYCHDIALKYFTITNKAKHRCTCVLLETAITLVWKTSLFVGFNSIANCWYKFNYYTIARLAGIIRE